MDLVLKIQIDNVPLELPRSLSCYAAIIFRTCPIRLRNHKFQCSFEWIAIRAVSSRYAEEILMRKSLLRFYHITRLHGKNSREGISPRFYCATRFRKLRTTLATPDFKYFLDRSSILQRKSSHGRHFALFPSKDHFFPCSTEPPVLFQSRISCIYASLSLAIVSTVPSRLAACLTLPLILHGRSRPARSRGAEGKEERRTITDDAKGGERGQGEGAQKPGGGPPFVRDERVRASFCFSSIRERLRPKCHCWRSGLLSDRWDEREMAISVSRTFLLYVRTVATLIDQSRSCSRGICI